MVTEKINELAGLRAKVAELEASLQRELASELAGLPAQYGFESVGAFVKAVQAATGKRRGRKPGTPQPARGKKHRKRAKITDEIRAEVKRMVGEKKTGTEIAKALGISLPSVQNVKKAAGLVKRTKGAKT